MKGYDFVDGGGVGGLDEVGRGGGFVFGDFAEGGGVEVVGELGL